MAKAAEQPYHDELLSSSKARRTVCVHGRFQPLHIGHMGVIRAARELGDFLIVGIAQVLRTSSVGEQQWDASTAPLSFFERAAILREALCEDGIDPASMIVVPFPIEHPDLIPQFVPREALLVTSAMDGCDRRKIERLEAMGYQQTALRSDGMGTSASEVRRLLVTGDARWRQLVPSATSRHIDLLDVRSRMTPPG